MLSQPPHRSFHFCNDSAIWLSSKKVIIRHDTGDKLYSSNARNRSARVNSLIWFALVLLVIWIVVRVVFAISSAVLHLVWVVALILLIVWLVRRFL